jgi:NAD(P)-dependent dehydrogenase (short-subunit alcohol dehydrogenase family)
MKLAILGASGGTGRELVQQALARGHEVSALVRDPARSGFDPHPRLRLVRVDVNDPSSLRQALGADVTLLSALGIGKGGRSGVLTAGARVVVAARPARIIWLGAFGTGPTARQGGWAVRLLLALVLGKEVQDKVEADATVLRAGGTVFHAGPLGQGPVATTRRTVSTDEVPRRLFPAGVGRATVAVAMLEEAESPRFTGAIAVPLAR